MITDNLRDEIVNKRLQALEAFQKEFVPAVKAAFEMIDAGVIMSVNGLNNLNNRLEKVEAMLGIQTGNPKRESEDSSGGGESGGAREEAREALPRDCGLAPRSVAETGENRPN